MCSSVTLLILAVLTARGDSDPGHVDARSEKPVAWPGGIIPYDISNLTEAQQTQARRAMERWQETGARISFTPRSNQVEYVLFTGNTNAGNNTSQVGFRKGRRADINITAFWWHQGEWMPAHELGHVLGFFHEHCRWDRDEFVTIHYDTSNLAGKVATIGFPNGWIVSSSAHDYYSIMHYRVCWAGKCEPNAKTATAPALRSHRR
jgi:tolloid-like protein 2